MFAKIHHSYIDGKCKTSYEYVLDLNRTTYYVFSLPSFLVFLFVSFIIDGISSVFFSPSFLLLHAFVIMAIVVFTSSAVQFLSLSTRLSCSSTSISSRRLRRSNKTHIYFPNQINAICLSTHIIYLVCSQSVSQSVIIIHTQTRITRFNFIGIFMACLRFDVQYCTLWKCGTMCKFFY